MERIVTLEDLTKNLEQLLNSGCYVGTEPNGKKFLIETRVLVERINGLRVYIRSREHPPPHFHVSSANTIAAFDVIDCSLIEGSIDGKTRELVEYWYRNLGGRSKLIEFWNKTRPGDCPVGPVRV